MGRLSADGELSRWRSSDSPRRSRPSWHRPRCTIALLSCQFLWRRNGHVTLPSESEQRLIELQTQIAHCTRCEEAGFIARANPVAGARGRVGDRIMLIGQAPGRLSVERQLPFGGPGGAILDRWLTRAGFPPAFLREGVYLSAL